MKLEEALKQLAARKDFVGAASYQKVTVPIGKKRTTFYVPMRQDPDVVQSISMYTAKNFKGYVSHETGILLPKSLADEAGIKYQRIKVEGQIGVIA